MEVRVVGASEGPLELVLLFTSAASHRAHAAEAAARRVRADFLAVQQLDELDAHLAERRPSVVLVDAATEAAAACTRVRDNPRLGNVPLIVLADDVSDLAFAEALSWGAEDLVRFGDEEGLARRLRQATGRGEPMSIRRRGLALVADARRESRILTARVLRNAGYDVTFALDADEALRAAGQPEVSLVVSAPRLDDGEVSLVARARRRGIEVPWVVGASPRELRDERHRLQGLEKVSTYDAFGPADNLLFVANELTRGEAHESRASARLLFGATVLFRVAGAEVDECGYCHNVSEGGLYVRTLAPLSPGVHAWLELRPPRSDRRVRLDASVAWVRGLGAHETATNPPGMGLQLQGSSPLEVERWVHSYRAFASELLAEGAP